MEIELGQVIDDHQTAEVMKGSIEDLINKLSNASGGLELSCLDAIVVPADFTAEVIRFQEAHGFLERGHTDREEALAVAKTMNYESEGELKSIIFYSKVFLGCLFSDDPQQRQLAAHLLHHELAHVGLGVDPTLQ